MLVGSNMKTKIIFIISVLFMMQGCILTPTQNNESKKQQIEKVHKISEEKKIAAMKRTAEFKELQEINNAEEAIRLDELKNIKELNKLDQALKVEELKKIKEIETAEIKAQEKRDHLIANNKDLLYFYISHSKNEKTNHISETFDVQTDSQGFGHLYSFNGEKSLILSEVVSKMAEQLLLNFPKELKQEPIAMTSIVDLNDHKVTNWLGQTISEQFIHELSIRQFQIIDIKVTGNIQIKPSGEFAISREWKQLKKNIDVNRVLTGTMSRNEEGLILNVRIVNADTNLVETTSSAFIPSNMFMDGIYSYQSKKRFSRDSSSLEPGKDQVTLIN